MERLRVWFRSYGRYCLIMVAGVLGVVLGFPALISAQQPTATITQVEGEVVVSVQSGDPVAATVGTVLHQEDRIQTSAKAQVTLEFSDGSISKLGENTNITILELTQTPETGARKSHMKLLWGRVRSWLSPGHQAPGSSFNVETPNALVGVKFSEPDSEVIYDPEKEITTAIAHRFDIILTELATGATLLIPQGQSGTVDKHGIERIARILNPPPQAPASPPLAPVDPVTKTGVPLKTIAAVGLGTAAVAGGVAAIVMSSDDDPGSSYPFSGTFTQSQTLEAGVTQTVVFHLSQKGRSITGTREETVIAENCCTAAGRGTVTGTADDTTAMLTVTRGAGQCFCSGSTQFVFPPQAAQVSLPQENGQLIGIFWNEETGSGQATLINNGSILSYYGNEYTRQ